MMPMSATPDETLPIIFMAIAILFGLAFFLAIRIFFILTLKKALMRCSEENRTLSPGLLWLSLIPLFNMIWDFIVVINMGDSLHREFQKRGITAEPYPGKTLGLAFCILNICSFIPIIGFLPGLAGLICWIIYWVKIAGFSKQLDTPYNPTPAEPQPPQTAQA